MLRLFCNQQNSCTYVVYYRTGQLACHEATYKEIPTILTFLNCLLVCYQPLHCLLYLSMQVQEKTLGEVVMCCDVV